MTQLLHIDSSVENDATSNTRRVSAAIVEALTVGLADTRVIHLDVAAAPPPHIDGSLRAGWVSAADQRSQAQVEVITRSEGLIAQLMAADILVIGAPMYNFSVPSSLKAWIDHIAIAGLTFRYTAEGRPEGLVLGKKVYLALASGGVYSEGPMAALDHHESYLRAVLGFLGMTDVESIRVEGVAFGANQASAALSASLKSATQVVPAPQPA